MKNTYKILASSVLLAIAVHSPLLAAKQRDTFLFGKDENHTLVINNRVLAIVNGNAISVVDLQKKMDMLFYHDYPEYSNSIQARYQFYQVHWKQVLQDLIDKELVLADAEEAKLNISTGDVRQEMESLFGPNIIHNLDKAGLTYDEALRMVQGDVTIRRMIFIRVNNKVLRKVTPQMVRLAYEDFSKKNIREEKWIYNVISIRDSDPTKGAEAANWVSHLLEEGTPIDELNNKIKENPLATSSVINVSQEYNHEEKEVSESYKEVLNQMADQTFSKPIAQQSRADKSTVFRIFYLKEKKPGGVIPFNEVESKLKEELMNQEMAKETEAYLKKLRKHFDVLDLKEMTNDMQPFALK